MIIVLGPGRSGTSTVARILHNNLGVSMGRRFRSPDDANPQGYFEDLDFRDLNHTALWKKISMDIQIKHLFDGRQEPWGLKDPRICELHSEDSKYIKNAKFIVAMRQPEQIIQSMMQHYGWSEEQSGQLLMVRLNGIQRLLEGHAALYIDFSVKRKDSELIKIIQKVL